MFYLNSLVGFDRFAEDNHIPDRRIEGLVPSSLVIVDIFANDSPVLKLEGFFAKNLIGMDQAIEYESVSGSVKVPP